MNRGTTISTAEAGESSPSCRTPVAQGEDIITTRHGQPVARLLPSPRYRRQKAAQAIEWLKELRKSLRPRGIDQRQLRDEGRQQDMDSPGTAMPEAFSRNIAGSSPAGSDTSLRKG